MVVLPAATPAIYTSNVYTRERFTGNYCKQQSRDICCDDRNDDCSMDISDRTGSSLCYCDEFCNQHLPVDCCPDYVVTCNKTKLGPPVDECYLPGDKCNRGCNECMCVYDTFILSELRTRYKWQCSNDPCINDIDLIRNINQRQYSGSFQASEYDQFTGIKLKDGLKYFLGTILSKHQVKAQTSVKSQCDTDLKYFDSRTKWAGLIHGAADQGKCGASWAFSTAGVAADRLSILSDGAYSTDLSVQQMLSCSNFVSSSVACEGGRLEDAWWWLKKQGVVSASCYPYISGQSMQKEYCRNTIRCADGSLPNVQKMASAYRVNSSECAIKQEILAYGPVQSTMMVKPDFFVYKSGIYASTGLAQTVPSRIDEYQGYHSVKIIGWGEENRQKYWLCVNSWGTKWGENGMFKIRRGTNECGIEDYVIGCWARVHHKRHLRV
ncbi:F26E4.3 [Bugula neritina]|uniref:F26E4.3 n=1 Tax=Bugula neritina TaxID=10212 RepID=A0A7J7JI73_BUGNE|nr:F26E4.3 [Bugula neritina]